MPRRREVPKREVLPDPVYNSTLVAKFVSAMMWDGKRSVAEGILYKSLAKISEKTGEDALKVFKRAIENLQPKVEVKSKRVGGANYQVPVEVNTSRRTALAMRWLVGYARSRGEKTMVDAWAPAAAAATAARDAGQDLAACLEAAARAAANGAEATSAMVATKGRSARLGERSLGHVDAGAASTALMLEALARAVATRAAI